MPAASLYEMARQRLIKNIHMLYSVSDLPFHFVEPVLRFVQNPDQLQLLETNCEQLRGETGQIWLRFIKRDIPNWESRAYQPRDPKNWSKAYRKLKREAEKEKLAQEEELKQQLKAVDRTKTKTQIVDSRVAMGATRMFSTHKSSCNSSWGPATGAPAKTGKVAFDKLKRGMFDHKRERPTMHPMSEDVLAQRKTKLRQAPAHMVRMAANEAPQKRIDKAREAADSAAKKAEVRPPVNMPPPHEPRITQRPVPQRSTPVIRTSLPKDYHAKRQKDPVVEAAAVPAATPAPVLKRKRPEYSMFQPKKRKL